jgi:hypothetical protein
MFSKKLSKGSQLAIAGVLFAGILFSALALPRPAQAHCDSEKGPVVAAAHQALEKGDVKLILPYVQADSEKELTAAFKETQMVRKTGGKTMELADRYFIETAVRLHRAGEGAAYNGVTDENTPESILVADKAMASGSLDETYKLLDQLVQTGVQEKYEAVVKAREEAAHLGTVEAHRERVEAELMFEKYVYELYGSATAANPHAEGQH